MASGPGSEPARPRLHPQAEALIALVGRPGNPQLYELDVPGARLATRKMHFAFRPPKPAGVATRDVVLSRAGDEGGPLAARIYRPAAAAAGDLLPALVWFHGGGWVVGDLDSHDVLCGELCLLARAAVVSVDYRLAPEHPFPAAVTDAAFAVRTLRLKARELGLDGARVAVGGDSAGGNLATVAALILRDAGEPPLRLQLLVYPSTDQVTASPSRTAFARGFLLDRETMRYYGKRYLRSRAEAADWRASPSLAPSLAGLPPALLIAAECDPLADEGKAYAARLEASGVPVTYSCYPGMIHNFFLLGRAFDAGRSAVKEAGLALLHALA